MSIDLERRASLAAGAPTGTRTTSLRHPHVYRPRSSHDLGLARLWTYRSLVPYFGWSVVARRFRGAWLGWLWLPLRPALQMLTKGFVFGGMLHLGSGDRPYVIFLMVGQASWDFFDRAVYMSFRPLNTHRRILNNAPIPWAAPVLSSLLVAAVDAAQFVAIGGLASIYYKITQGSFYIDVGLGAGARVLAGTILLALWSMGAAFIVAPLVIKARDLRYIVRYVMSFLYFLTPVLYATSNLPAQYRAVAEYNPITAPIELIKDGLLSTGGPTMTSLFISVIGAAIVVPVGLALCSFFERQAHAQL